MLTFNEILFAFLLPALVCGIIALVAAMATTASDSARRANDFAGALAFGLAYLCAHVTLVGMPSWPSAERTPSALDWLGWSIAAIVLCAWIFLVPVGNRSLGWLIRTLLSASFVYLSLRGWIQGSGSPALAIIFFLVLNVAWTSTSAFVGRSPGPVAVLPLFVAMFCASVACLLGHSLLVAELAGALCCCLGASAVVARISPRYRLSAGSVAVFMLVFGGVLLNGMFFSDVHWSSGVLSILSLIAPWLAIRSSSTTRGPWTAAAKAAALASLFGAGAIVAAHLNAPSYEY